MEKNMLILGSFWPILAFFLQILKQLKTFFFQNQCAHHPRTRRRVLDLCAKFDVLRPSQS